MCIIIELATSGQVMTLFHNGFQVCSLKPVFYKLIHLDLLLSFKLLVIQVKNINMSLLHFFMKLHIGQI